MATVTDSASDNPQEKLRTEAMELHDQAIAKLLQAELKLFEIGLPARAALAKTQHFRTQMQASRKLITTIVLDHLA